MEYRKKPVVIEAFRYGMDSRPDWFDTKVTSNEIITYVGTDIRDSSQYYCEIKTLEGVMRGNCGDYIIKGVQGEVYPCKPDIFEMTYEIASTSSQTEISNSTITDQIDGIIFQLPFDDKIKLWKLIEKLVEENRTEISDEEIEEMLFHHSNEYAYGFKDAIKWYREQLKSRQ